MIVWARHHRDGYEVTSRGDQRFSPLFATMEDGRTIEAHYHCDVKGFDPGGTAWRQFKGKRPAGVTEAQLWTGYLRLYKDWGWKNMPLLAELDVIVRRDHESILVDRFATGEINQAHALAVLLNHLASQNYAAREYRGRYVWERNEPTWLPRRGRPGPPEVF